ncbi:2Fe-2S iron-sulfur cluster-binding protein [Natrarchaeobius sp. A-rgal3]|uniref:2Fe-2S iron-sulfur cluster-binding protein n=1 Tax=Natrarchaeobius versutus TaxID=1679078 RepID=UPI00350EE6C3
MTRYDVTLEWPDGREESVPVDETETVLEAAHRVGVRLPYDCRTGTCTTCVGQVLAVGSDGGDSGATDRPIEATEAFGYRTAPRALSDGEHTEGYVLLCIALPRTDCRVRVGPMVRAEVGDSPWK